MNELWLASYVVLWVVVAALAIIELGLLRQLGLIQLRLGPDPGPLITKEGLERGARAPDFTATDLRTEQLVRLGAFRGRRALLIFVTPTCIACRQLASHLNDFIRDHGREVQVLAICHGSASTCGQFSDAYRLKAPLLLDSTNAIAESYEVQMSPFGFLVDEDGLIRIRGVVNSLPQLELLLAEEGTVSPAPWPVAASARQKPDAMAKETSEQGMGDVARA